MMKALPFWQGFLLKYCIEKEEKMIMPRIASHKKRNYSEMCRQSKHRSGVDTIMRFTLHRIFSLILLFTICGSFVFSISAAASDYCPDTKLYELPLGSEYLIEEKKEVNRFSYGRSAIGKFKVKGPVDRETSRGEKTAYSVSGPVTFTYQYNGDFQTDNRDAWNLYDHSEKNVNGEKIPKKVKSGAIIVQKSNDGFHWENAAEPTTDFFTEFPDGSMNLYTTREEDIKGGMFYRVMVVYAMTHRTASQKVIGFIPKDEYERIECIEAYECYIELNSNLITINDIVTRDVLKNATSTNSGFYIQKNGSTGNVVVQKGSQRYTQVKDYDCFTEPGKYDITISKPLGGKYNYSITVNKGLQFSSMQPDVFASEKDEGFLTDKKISGKTVFGETSLTELSIARNAGARISTSERKGLNAYGITGQSVSLFLKVKADEDNVGKGWKLRYDDWGKKEKEKLMGSMTGEIGKGALIVQTSRDGEKWVNAEKGCYANAVYTTDFAEHYRTNENVLIYTPSGKDVMDGVYLRVYFAYQVYNENAKEYVDYIEEYAFYLCSSELNAVTIHNLSAEGTIEKNLGDADEDTIKLYRTAETMLTGDCTTTGFQIDKTLNPTAKCRVKRNGKEVSVPADGKFTQNGKYEIHLASAVGDHKDIVIYVDRHTPEEAMKIYFGNGFLRGKRIFAEGEYPVYEGGKVRFNLLSAPEDMRAVSGTIRNMSTGSEFKVLENHPPKDTTIREPGTYEAVFTTNPDYQDEDASGDTRVFTFRFTIIAEGTAPGPTVNKKSLAEYAHSTAIDSMPVYYGLTYQSAAKGDITLAFATKEAAIKYAYSYEKGMVEQQEDGSYRYDGVLQFNGRKEKYESNWDLTDVVNDIAEKSVERLYFNMADPFTYLTLSPKVLEDSKNPRIYELSKSIVIFAEGEKEILTDLDSLPIINDKPYAYLNPYDQSEDKGVNCFQFITDDYGGLDSRNVVMWDCNGKKYDIQYSRSVGQQLQTAGCASGVVEIKETTKFGDTAEYKAVYIAPNDNHTEVTLKSYNGPQSEKIILSKKMTGKTITLQSFSIESIKDDLDPYALVIVKNGQRQFFYTAMDDAKEIWSEPGSYELTCVNRLGYGYTVNIAVTESDNAVIQFAGDGIEGIPSILTYQGAKKIALPTASRYGYDFAGFKDEKTGEVYMDMLPAVTFSGESTFAAVWNPKKVSILLKDSDGNTIASADAKFGEIFDLSEYESEEKGGFKDWKHEGVLLENGNVLIDSEENIVLVAESGAKPGNGLSAASKVIVCIVVISLLTAVSGYYAYSRNKNLNNGKYGDGENEKGE